MTRSQNISNTIMIFNVIYLPASALIPCCCQTRSTTQLNWKHCWAVVLAQKKCDKQMTWNMTMEKQGKTSSSLGTSRGNWFLLLPLQMDRNSRTFLLNKAPSKRIWNLKMDHWKKEIPNGETSKYHRKWWILAMMIGSHWVFLEPGLRWTHNPTFLQANPTWACRLDTWIGCEMAVSPSSH